MNQYLTFDGVASNTLGIILTKAPERPIPERKVDRVSVPGRNGDIIIEQDAWENVTLSYEIAYGGNVFGDYSEDTGVIAAWLHGSSGYRRLEDTFDADHYRLATVIRDHDTESILARIGRATLEFDADPRRFLKSGETEITVASGDTLENPTVFTAKPRIEVLGTEDGAGTITIGSKTISINQIADGMVLDCEHEKATDTAGTLNYSLRVSGSYPVLAAGEQEITFTGDITSLKIIPNWWEL